MKAGAGMLCAWCGAEDDSLVRGRKPLPSPGDAAVCTRCAQINVYVATPHGMALDRAKPQEIERMHRTVPHFARLQELIRTGDDIEPAELLSLMGIHDDLAAEVADRRQRRAELAARLQLPSIHHVADAADAFALLGRLTAAALPTLILEEQRNLVWREELRAAPPEPEILASLTHVDGDKPVLICAALMPGGTANVHAVAMDLLHSRHEPFSPNAGGTGMVASVATPDLMTSPLLATLSLGGALEYPFNIVSREGRRRPARYRLLVPVLPRQVSAPPRPRPEPPRPPRPPLVEMQRAEPPPPAMKLCDTCGRSLPLINANWKRDLDQRDGMATTCRSCMSAAPAPSLPELMAAARPARGKKKKERRGMASTLDEDWKGRALAAEAKVKELQSMVTRLMHENTRLEGELRSPRPAFPVGRP